MPGRAVTACRPGPRRYRTSSGCFLRRAGGPRRRSRWRATGRAGGGGAPPLPPRPQPSSRGRDAGLLLPAAAPAPSAAGPAERPAASCRPRRGAGPGRARRPQKRARGPARPTRGAPRRPGEAQAAPSPPPLPDPPPPAPGPVSALYLETSARRILLGTSPRASPTGNTHPPPPPGAGGGGAGAAAAARKRRRGGPFAGRERAAPLRCAGPGSAGSDCGSPRPRWGSTSALHPGKRRRPRPRSRRRGVVTSRPDGAWRGGEGRGGAERSVAVALLECATAR